MINAERIQRTKRCRGAMLLLAMLAVVLTATFLNGAAVLSRRVRQESLAFYRRARLRAVLLETAARRLRAKTSAWTGMENTPDGIRVQWTISRPSVPAEPTGEFQAIAEDADGGRRECRAVFRIGRDGVCHILAWWEP